VPFVVDASITLAWYLAGEATLYTLAVAELLTTTIGFAPAIWPLEVANAVLVSERRGRLTQADTEDGLQLLAALPVVAEESAPQRIWDSVTSLARGQNLSSYDAAYVELAARRGLSLATRDGRLMEAANRIGVPLTQA
jgi:predicted nucleic acid-binding protein